MQKDEGVPAFIQVSFVQELPSLHWPLELQLTQAFDPPHTPQTSGAEQLGHVPQEFGAVQTGQAEPVLLQLIPQESVPVVVCPQAGVEALQVILVVVPPQTPQASFTCVLPQALLQPEGAVQLGGLPQEFGAVQDAQAEPVLLQLLPQESVPVVVCPQAGVGAPQVIVVVVPPQTPQASFVFVLPQALSQPETVEQFGGLPQGVEPEQVAGGDAQAPHEGVSQ